MKDMSIIEIVTESLQELSDSVTDKVEDLIDTIRYMDALEKVLILSLSAVVLLGGSLVYDCTFNTKEVIIHGKVLDMSYTPSSSSTGSGIGVSPKGEAVVVTTTNFKSAKWGLVIQSDEEVFAIDVSPVKFYSTKTGELIEIHCTEGLWYGILDCTGE